MKQKKNNLALICTIGGHFEQLTNLNEFYDQYNHFWITNENKQTVSQLEKERKYFITMGHFKKPWTYLSQISPLIKIFASEKPTHILSTGSGRTVFIPFIFAKLMRIKFLYIDTFSRVNGYSKMGDFLLKTGNQIYTQWQDSINGKALFIGPIFKKAKDVQKKHDPDFVFVSVGTRAESFTRIIKAVEELVKNGIIQERVIVQAGHTKYHSSCLEIFDFCTPAEINKLIINAKYVVTQESAGIGAKCLKSCTKFIVMPRDYRYGELPAQSDMNEDLHFKLEKMGYAKVVNTVEELKLAVEKVDELKSGFEFDNKLAISTLNQVMEEL